MGRIEACQALFNITVIVILGPGTRVPYLLPLHPDSRGAESPVQFCIPEVAPDRAWAHRWTCGLPLAVRVKGRVLVEG